jgi:hypothetical protein
MYAPVTRVVQQADIAGTYTRLQTETIELDSILSPARLPVSPPGRGDVEVNISVQCMQAGRRK